jgi:hypothetical protein
LEGNLCVLPTFSTDDGIHLPTRAIAATTVLAACHTARCTTLGLVREALLSVVLLVFNTESEGFSTVDTSEGFVLIAHQ